MTARSKYAESARYGRPQALTAARPRDSPNVANDGILGHDLKVLATDDVTAASGGDKDVTLRGGLLHGRDLESSHGGLESVDGVDLGDDDTRAVRAERLGALRDQTRKLTKCEPSGQAPDTTRPCHSRPCRHLRNQRRWRPCQQA